MSSYLFGQEGKTLLQFYFAVVVHRFLNRSGKWRKNTTFLDLLKETGLLQPKCVTDDHTWLLRSVSDPTRRECWSQAGQRTVRTERTGWRTSRASIPFWLTLTQECNPPNVFVRLSVGGRKLWLLLFILLAPPRALRKIGFHPNLWIANA